MLPDKRFLRQPKHFWANVRTIGQQVGYATRRTKKNPISVIKVPTIDQIRDAYGRVGLDPVDLIRKDGRPTKLGKTLLDYLDYRASRLNNFVEPRLMDVKRARREYLALKKKLKPKCPLPKNKQKGKKKGPAYFTCIINMLIEANVYGRPCDYDPRELTTVTVNNAPLRTLARRVDGAFPAAVNPIAIWEIKEYYYTTTFGSRVADGVYETLLDGMELEELADQERIDVKHLLMIDAHYTWWDCGKSYLCRLLDMLHMGYVDEVLFGSEVLDRLPTIARQWVDIQRKRMR